MKSEAARKTYMELLEASGAVLQTGNVGLISIDQTQLSSHVLSCHQNGSVYETFESSNVL